ncbi:MAG: DUF4959 domain-containing protein [Prevotella sp.]|nr:DUF4959 domain-containing protein [Prevotella sp.]
MKLKYYLIALMACALWSCSEDDETFDSGLTPNAFSFKPITGGAVMYYQLPNDPEVTGLYVRYIDAFGKPVTRSASTSNDSLLLTGFNEAVSNVPAEVYIQRRDRSESNPIMVSFSTKDSGPVDFLKNVEVLSNWEGFTLRYSTPNYSEGLVNVFYLGKDPQTGASDTVLISSFTLEDAAYDETISFKVKQAVEKPTVVIRTEDFRGNRVGEKAFDGVEFLEQALLSPSLFDFYCACSIIEDYQYKQISPSFLFDGDVLGESCFNLGCIATFAAGPNAYGPDPTPMYIDMRKNYVTAGIKLYNLLFNTVSDQSHQWLGSYGQSLMLPCDVTLFAAVDDGDTTPLEEKDMDNLNWKRVASFFQDPDLPNAARWCPWTFPNAGFEGLSSIEDLRAHGPESMEMVVSAAGQNDGYRYLKIVVNNAFNLDSDFGIPVFRNDPHIISFHELEVYTKKD